MAIREKREFELKAMLNSQDGKQHTRLKRLYFDACGGTPPAGTSWLASDMIPAILDFEERRGDFDDGSGEAV